MDLQVFCFHRDLRRNLCRNPDNDRAPWCYTTDPSVRWEYCNVDKCTSSPTGPPVAQDRPGAATAEPSKSALQRRSSLWLIDYSSFCFSVLDCKTGNGESYRGPTSITVTGVTCQAWSAQSPHQHHSFTPRSHPDKGLEGNVRSHVGVVVDLLVSSSVHPVFPLRAAGTRTEM